MKPSSFVVSANGPDLLASRALPPKSDPALALSSVAEFERQGLDRDVQERLVGLYRRLPAEDMNDLLNAHRREEDMLHAEAIRGMSLGGPAVDYAEQSGKLSNKNKGLLMPRPRVTH